MSDHDTLDSASRESRGAGRIKKIVQLYQGGLSTSAIAERFGCNANTVRQALKSSGITLDISRRRYDGHGGVTRSNNCLHISMRTRG